MAAAASLSVGRRDLEALRGFIYSITGIWPRVGHIRSEMTCPVFSLEEVTEGGTVIHNIIPIWHVRCTPLPYTEDVASSARFAVLLVSVSRV